MYIAFLCHSPAYKFPIIELKIVAVLKTYVLLQCGQLPFVHFAALDNKYVAKNL